jgi:hypothetical protein
MDKPAQHIVQMANEAIANSAINKGTQATASRWIQTARVMPSGDVFLYAVDAPTAERLQFQRGEWQNFLGEGTEISAPTYGVILSNIPTESLNITQQVTHIRQVSTENDYVFQTEDVVGLRWLAKPKKSKSTNALVVEFYDSNKANACINAERISWLGTPRRYCAIDLRAFLRV